MAASGSSDPKPATGYPAPPPASTAYPYPAAPYYGAAPPHPQQQPPPYYYATNNANPYYHNHNANNNPYYAPGRAAPVPLLRRFFFAVIAIFLAVGVATIIVWLVLRPRLPAVSVTSASVSSFNFSAPSSLLTSNFDITLSVYNPNKKMSVGYDNVDTAVFLGSALAAENPLPPFSQEKGNSTVITARLASVSRYLEDTSALGNKAKDKVLYVNFRLFSWVRFWDGGWRTRGHSLRVYCDDLKINFTSAEATTGSLVGGPRSCLVSL